MSDPDAEAVVATVDGLATLGAQGDLDRVNRTFALAHELAERLKQEDVRVAVTVLRLLLLVPAFSEARKR